MKKRKRETAADPVKSDAKPAYLTAILEDLEKAYRLSRDVPVNKILERVIKNLKEL